MIKKEIEILKPFVTEERLAKFEKIIAYRTKYATVVLEDIYQPHNASAVLRSCELFGVQDVHIIENDNKYSVNPDVAVGSSKWLTLNKYSESKNNTLQAINSLKQQGYRIVATTPHTNDVELQDFDVTKGKFALVFGSEMPGITDLVMENADEYLKINMYGFTESFNISVSVAIILHELTEKLKKSNVKWQLSEEEQDEIMLNWLKITIKDADGIIKIKKNNEQ
ncbi:MAG: RNA methyltransferase [Bacteroidales bacterium]|nr:RNA methyltransferase [Bacteroidales bacterium]